MCDCTCPHSWPATFDRLKSVTDNSPLAFRNDKPRLKLMSVSKHTTSNTNKDKKKVRERKTKSPTDLHTTEREEECFRLLLQEHYSKLKTPQRKQTLLVQALRDIESKNLKTTSYRRVYSLVSVKTLTGGSLLFNKTKHESSVSIFLSDHKDWD